MYGTLNIVESLEKPGQLTGGVTETLKCEIKTRP